MIVQATAMGSAMRGIAEWLASIGLGEYAQRFAENAIDLSVVGDLTEQDLIPLGHRRKMLRAISELDRAALAPAEQRLNRCRATSPSDAT
jgi:hypothetical protein